MKYQLKHLSFGELWGQAFNLYFDNFIPLFLITLISNAPIIFQQILNTQAIEQRLGLSETAAALTAIVTLLLMSAGYLFSTALTTELLSKKYLKQSPGIKQYIRNILPRLIPLLGLFLLLALVIGAVIFFFGLFFGFLPFPFSLLALVPGIYFLCRLYTAPVILIVEGKKVFESYRRSLRLTIKKAFMIFAFILILWAINFGVDKGSAALLPFFIQLPLSLTTQMVFFNLLNSIVSVLVMPIGSCVAILIYFNLRIEKEGFDLEHLVDQFEMPSGMPGDPGQGGQEGGGAFPPHPGDNH